MVKSNKTSSSSSAASSMGLLLRRRCYTKCASRNFLLLLLIFSNFFTTLNSQSPPTLKEHPNLLDLNKPFHTLLYNPNYQPQQQRQPKPNESPLLFPTHPHDGFRSLHVNYPLTLPQHHHYPHLEHHLLDQQQQQSFVDNSILPPQALQHQQSPSALLVPTLPYLPPIFRLPATAMTQHKAYAAPLASLGGVVSVVPAAESVEPDAPKMVAFSSVVQQEKSPTHEDNANGTLPANEPDLLGLISSELLELQNTPQPTQFTQNQNSSLESERISNNTTIEVSSTSTSTVATTSTSTSTTPTKISTSTSSPSTTSIQTTTATEVPAEGESQLSGSKVEDELIKWARESPNLNVDKKEVQTTNNSVKSLAEGGLKVVGSLEGVTDLEGFLQAANLSAHDAKTFLRLMEKVLEEEVSKRLEKRVNGTVQIPSNSNNKNFGNEVVADESEGIRRMNGGDRETEERLLKELEERQKMTVKTVNTRLAYEAEEDAASGNSESTVSTLSPLIRGVTVPVEPGEEADVAIDASALKRLLTPSEQKATTIAVVNKEQNYKAKEQAEFDHLLHTLKTVEQVRESAAEAEKETEKEADTDLLLVVPPGTDARLPQKLQQKSLLTTAAIPTTTVIPSSTVKVVSLRQRNKARGGQGKQNPLHSNTNASASAQQLAMMQTRLSSRHAPKTTFEHLVEDYKTRLGGGQNGINDLLKVLRNANIGFFDSQSNPSVVKILRRID